MALPGRSQTFALENCRDLLNKLEREAERFANAQGADERIDHAFNAAVTAWHLCDWVFNDMTADQRGSLLATPKLGRSTRTRANRMSRALHVQACGDRVQTLDRRKAPRSKCCSHRHSNTSAFRF
jgi:hypothetical protein